MWKKLHINKRRILYTVCFFVFCLIDQRTKTASGLDGLGETFRDLAGVVMAVLILSHYHLSDFKKRKLPYLIWSLLCVAGGAFFLLYGQPLVYFLNNRMMLVLEVYLLGIVIFQTIMEVAAEKKRPLLNVYFAALWLLMMVFMIISRSEYTWPLIYLVRFGCFYLTDYTKEEQEDLFQGMLNGIILGFFILQGWCFAFRPYDEVRYKGVYNNSNLNALFYLIVLAAALAKLVYVYRAECGRWIKAYYWLGVGSVLGFLFLTISRTGWMTAVVLVLVGLFLLRPVMPSRSFFKGIVKNGLIMVLCFCITFPLVFGAVRFLPPFFHHPVWFFGEWNEDKVHSWDKWDSDKFVNPDKLVNTAGSRVTKILAGVFGGQTEAGQPKKVRREVQVTPEQQRLYDEAFAAGFAIDPADRGDAVLLRAAIYRYYAHLLNFRGHPDYELGFQIVPDQNIGHAHNIYLQYGVVFGIPVLILFVVLLVWSIIGLVRRFREEKSEQPAGYLLFLLVPAVFGLLEYCWGEGSLAIILLFMVWRRMICDETGR